MKQSDALKILDAGASVFLTGAPGAGKTYVLNQFISSARAAGKIVSITATTGIASTHINGQTIHSWSGMGVAQAPTEALLRRVRTYRGKAIRRADVLVIDEISMMPAWQFDMVDRICRAIRHDAGHPFGGLQVVISGDLFQLPPVVRTNRGNSDDGLRMDPDVAQYRQSYADAGHDPDGFITESFVWRDFDPVVCYLTEQHRQDHGELLSVLTHIREGAVTPADRAVLDGRVGAVPVDMPIVRLYPTNRQADQLNDMRLYQLPGMSHDFIATSTGSPTLVKQLKRSMLAPERLSLKKGAVVMALRNDSEHRYVNGSIGVVTDFEKRLSSRAPSAASEAAGGAPIVSFDNGNVVTMHPADWQITDNDAVLAEVSQIPLRCAWGITIHKSQGMTLDAAVMDLRRTFAPGMGYVALSRVESLDGLYLEGVGPRAFEVSEGAMRIDKELVARSEKACETLGRVGAIALTKVDGASSADDGEDDEFAQGVLF